MKKILLFMVVMPIGTAIVCYIALQFGAKPVFAIGLTAIGIVLIAPITMPATSAAAVATLIGVPVMFGEMFAERFPVIVAFAVIVAMLAALAASHARKELHSRSGIVILTAHNILWAYTTGFAVHFGVTLAGGGMLAVAVILPLMLLWYETGTITGNWTTVS